MKTMRRQKNLEATTPSTIRSSDKEALSPLSPRLYAPSADKADDTITFYTIIAPVVKGGQFRDEGRKCSKGTMSRKGMKDDEAEMLNDNRN
jgi:hypothetical protein